MSTVIWDGRELVADSCFTHWTRTDAAGVTITHRTYGDLDKIIVAPGLSCDGETVEAIGVSGCASIIGFIKSKGISNPGVDMMKHAFFKDMAAQVDNGLSTLLVVTTSKVFNLTYTSYESGATDLAWGSYDRSTSLLGVGTGTHLLTAYRPKSFQRKPSVRPSARYLVRMASTVDTMTGGPMLAWSSHQGLRRGIPGFSQFRKHLEGIIIGVCWGWVEAKRKAVEERSTRELLKQI